MVGQRAILVLLATILSSTVGLGQGPDSSSARDAYERFERTLPDDPSVAARMLNTRYARQGIPLSFWIAPSVADSRLQDLSIHEGPCGKETIIQSTRIPPPDKRLEADRIIEFNATGTELHRWHVPIYNGFVGVRGNTALLNFRSDLVLEVDMNGSYRVAPKGTLPEPDVVTCPVNHGVGTSAYVRCVRIGGRTFAYQQTCT